MEPDEVSHKGDNNGNFCSQESRQMVNAVNGLMSQYCRLLIRMWLPSKKGSASWEGRWNSYWSLEILTVEHFVTFLQLQRLTSLGNVSSPRCMRVKNQWGAMFRKGDHHVLLSWQGQRWLLRVGHSKCMFSFYRCAVKSKATFHGSVH